MSIPSKRRSVKLAAIPASLVALAGAAPVSASQRPEETTYAGVRIGEPVTSYSKVQGIRSGFGLRADDETIKALENDASHVDYLGIPFSPEEFSQVRHQMDIQAALAIAGPRIVELAGPGFTGYWIDHSNGGEITVAALDPVDTDALKELFPADTQLIYKPSKLTFLELDQLHERVDLAYARDEKIDGASVVGTNVNIRDERIEVLVAGETDGVDAKLSKQFSSAVVSRPVNPGEYEFEAAGRNSFPPLFGGYQLNTDGTFCTSAFAVHGWGGGVPGQLTAGHCAGWYRPVSIFQGPSIGSVASRRFCNFPGCDTDVELVHTPGYAGPAYVYINDYNPGGKTWRLVKGSWTNGAAPGSLVHLSAGNRDATWTNWLWDFDFTAYGDGYRVEHAQSAHLCAQSGDSGSPVYTIDGNNGLYAGGGAWAVGILSGTSNKEVDCPSNELVFWSRIDRALNDMGVTLDTA